MEFAKRVWALHHRLVQSCHWLPPRRSRKVVVSLPPTPDGQPDGLRRCLRALFISRGCDPAGMIG